MAKLVLDIVTFSGICLLLAWIILFNRSTTDFLFLFTSEGVFSVISILGDLICYVGIAIWYLSIRKGNIPLYFRFVLGGIFFFALTDLYYYYVLYHHIYIVDSSVDFSYLMTLLLVAFGGLLAMRFDKTNFINSNELYSNTGRRSKELITLLCPIIAIIVQGFILAEFLMFISLIVIYIALDSYFESSIKNKDLLKRELQINNELECIIADRTQKLSETNMELHKKNKELSYLSNVDTLTQLYNRRYFLKTLDISIAKLDSDQTISLFYMDLDRFKLINDTYGHQMGDQVLIEISNRLARSTCENSTVARMGGDEFVFAYIGLLDHNSAIEMAKKLISTCSEEIIIDDYVFNPGLCIGVSIYPHDAQTADLLMKNADISLYHAKSQGTNKFAMFDFSINKRTQKRNEIELFLQKGDFFKDLKLFYQPQFSIPDGKLIGMEALIRWISNKNKIMTPVEFIQIAEETDQINEIGIWVLKEAVEQIIDWNTTYGQNLKMGINISPKQLDSTNLFKALNDVTQESRFDPQWLDIEITENIAMDSEYRLSQIFNLFKSIGMSVSVDDFGTGYSSISYLKHYTFDRLKIAKPLIDSMVTNQAGKQIVQAIILLAKTIGINTIAEGVETQEQLDVLTELGCEQIQGFLLGKPMPADEFEALFLSTQGEAFQSLGTTNTHLANFSLVPGQVPNI
ncbi:putative bifunctional diguanylate cyclase/phosphodiesterase [Acetobacterium paludosum]|nr:bifunctional diguanylate cyclase/phosphodiesterase [Acetobacterium paludosum]